MTNKILPGIQRRSRIQVPNEVIDCFSALLA